MVDDGTTRAAVVRAQQPAIRAADRAQAAVTVDFRGSAGPARLAEVVCRLLEQPLLQRALSRNARRLVDGQGAARVAARLTQLMHRHQRESIHAVA